MRTFTTHKQKPAFRIKETYLSNKSIKQKLIEALETVLDAYGEGDTLLMMQCKHALDRARRNP